MACQPGAPTKEVFHNRPGHLITFQAEFSFRGLQSLETLMVTSYLLFVLMPPVLSPLFFSLLQRSHTIFSRIPEVILLWVTIQNKSQEPAVYWSSGPTQTTQIAKLVILGGVPLGQLWKEFFIWFLSKDCFVKFRWILSLSLNERPPVLFFFSVLQRSSASPVNQPGCAWKRLRWSAGVGDISSEFITVQSLYKGSHSTLAFVFPPMKIVHTMTNLIHCRCSSWNIPNETTVNQLFTQRKRGRY